MRNPAPIYLAKNGQVVGPFDFAWIVEQIDDDKIKPDDLACIEGMREWRSLAETLLWSQAVLLTDMLLFAVEETIRVSEQNPDQRDIRNRVRAALPKDAPKSADVELLAKVIEVNGELHRNHSHYSKGDQMWNVDTLDFYPTAELVLYSQSYRDWPAAWIAAGGTIYNSRMVARKDAAVWSRLSDFGFPFPPFSMDGSTWIEDVSATEAVALGISEQPIKSLPRISGFKLVGAAKTSQ